MRTAQSILLIVMFRPHKSSTLELIWFIVASYVFLTRLDTLSPTVFFILFTVLYIAYSLLRVSRSNRYDIILLLEPIIIVSLLVIIFTQSALVLYAFLVITATIFIVYEFLLFIIPREYSKIHSNLGLLLLGSVSFWYGLNESTNVISEVVVLQIAGSEITTLTSSIIWMFFIMSFYFQSSASPSIPQYLVIKYVLRNNNYVLDTSSRIQRIKSILILAFFRYKYPIKLADPDVTLLLCQRDRQASVTVFIIDEPVKKEIVKENNESKEVNCDICATTPLQNWPRTVVWMHSELNLHHGETLEEKKEPSKNVFDDLSLCSSCSEEITIELLENNKISDEKIVVHRI